MVAQNKTSQKWNWETVVLSLIILAAVVVYFVAYKNFYDSLIVDVGPIRCEDGWRSSSVGEQGACSHHGGVDYGPINKVRTESSLFALLISVSFFLTAFFTLWLFVVIIDKFHGKSKAAKPVNVESEEPQNQNKAEIFVCSRCNIEMKSKSKKTGSKMQIPNIRIWMECPSCGYREEIPLE